MLCQAPHPTPPSIQSGSLKLGSEAVVALARPHPGLALLSFSTSVGDNPRLPSLPLPSSTFTFGRVGAARLSAVKVRRPGSAWWSAGPAGPGLSGALASWHQRGLRLQRAGRARWVGSWRLQSAWERRDRAGGRVRAGKAKAVRPAHSPARVIVRLACCWPRSASLLEAGQRLHPPKA